MPRRYPRDFRDDVVRVVRNRDDGVTIEQIATDFGVHPMTLHKWIRQADIDEGYRPGKGTGESGDGIPVAVTCRVLQLARQPFYRWRAAPITDAQTVEAYRANALFDAHKDDPEFGYGYLVEEARDAGEPMAERTAWRICNQNRW